MGMIYPEGDPKLWYYKVAKVKAIPENKREEYPKEDGGYYETFLDIDNAESFHSTKFLDACQALGVTEFVDRSKSDA